MEYIKLPECTNVFSALEAYERIKSILPDPKKITYISLPISSGGARRIFPQVDHKNIKEVASLNRSLADWILDHISNSNVLEHETNLVLPYHMIAPKVFGEFNYLLMWTYFISGISTYDAKNFEETLHENNIDIDLLNSYHKSHHERREIYAAVVNSFLNFANQNSINLNPINMLVALPDWDCSLGCSAEVAVARGFGINIRTIGFNLLHEDYDLVIKSNSIWAKILEGEDCIEPRFEVPTVRIPDGELLYLVTADLI